MIAAAALLGAAWATNFGGIQEITAGAWAAMQPQFEQLKAWLATEGPAALTSLQGAWATAWSGIETAFAPAISRIAYAYSNMVEGFSGMGPAFIGLQMAAEPVLTRIGQLLSWLGTVGAAVLSTAFNFAVNTIAALLENMAAIVGVLVEQMTATLNTISAVIEEVITLVQAAIDGDWATVWSPSALKPVFHWKAISTSCSGSICSK